MSPDTTNLWLKVGVVAMEFFKFLVRHFYPNNKSLFAFKLNVPELTHQMFDAKNKMLTVLISKVLLTSKRH